jgi:DNA-binding transcriptional LysR family regulator
VEVRNDSLAAVVAGLGLGICACLVEDRHPDLIRVSEVIHVWDVWVVTNPDARNNPRVCSVKEALMQLLEAVGDRLSGCKGGSAEADV